MDSHCIFEHIYATQQYKQIVHISLVIPADSMNPANKLWMVFINNMVSISSKH